MITTLKPPLTHSLLWMTLYRVSSWDLPVGVIDTIFKTISPESDRFCNSNSSPDGNIHNTKTTNQTA